MNAQPAPAARSARLPAESDEAWAAAVDWVINSRWFADPNLQDAFWGIVDGRYSVDEANDV